MGKELNCGRRQNDLLILESLKEIKERILSIEKLINSPAFIRNYDFIERHEGDQEALQNIMCNSYGFDKKFDGWELLKIILHDYAVRLETKKDLRKNIVNEICKYAVKAICFTFVAIISIVISGKLGILNYLAGILK